MAEWYSIVYIYHNLFIYSSINGHLGYFHILVIVNDASMNMKVPIPFWVNVNVFIFFRLISISVIAGKYGSSIFNFLKNFHSGCINLYSQQHKSDPFYPHSHWNLLFLIFSGNIYSNKYKVTWVGIQGIFLMINDVDYLLIMYMVIISMSLENMSIQIFCSFFNWIVCGEFYIEFYKVFIHSGY